MRRRNVTAAGRWYVEPEVEIDAVAAGGFQAGAGAYVRARPDYPPAAVEWLRRRLRIGERSRLLDVGAGTGKLTALLAAGGTDLVALEPVEAMRSQLSAVVPAAAVVAGTAEAVPLAGASVDGVVAAQAFHWFDGPRALAEFHRVLRPGGAIALVWNVRDRSADWVAAFSDIVDAHGDAIRRHEAEEWRSAFPHPGFGPLEEARFPNPQTITPSGILDRVSSTSFIALLTDIEREGVLDRVRRLLETHPATAGKREFTFPHVTRVFACDRL